MPHGKVTKSKDRKIMRQLLIALSMVLIVTTSSPVLTQALEITTDLTENINYDQPYKVFEIEVDPIGDSSLVTMDTETTVYPHSEYFLVEAELPSDQVEINEDTLFNEGDLLPFAVTDQLYDYPYFNGERGSFRDQATYINLYLYYSDALSDHYLVGPMDMNADVMGIFQISDLIMTQTYDIDHKLRQIYFDQLTDDLIERYELKAYIPTAVYADAKASMLRAEILYQQIDSSNNDYDLATTALEDAREAFHILTARYNNGMMEDKVTINLYVSQEVEEGESLEANVASIDEAIHSLPADVLRRLSNIYLLASWEMPASETLGFTLHGLARDNGTLFYVGDELIYKNLVYHEVGHLVDFASHALTDWVNSEMDSLSTQEDWVQIFEAEWADPDSYYNSTLESFAEGFGVYALEYFLDESPDLDAYPDSSLEDRPMTREYFANLFETLNY